MVEVLVWLLIVAPASPNQGTPRTLATFKSEQQCRHVLTSMDSEKQSPYMAKCISAYILTPAQ